MPHFHFDFLKRLRFLCTKEMYDDLCFYLDHETELYFSELFLIAVGYTIFTIFFLVLGIFYLGFNFQISIICIGIAVVSEVGFGMIKFYLHIRKDAIEIKEMLRMVR
jgi:hypothetical protein